MGRQRIVSREYKVMLRPDRFTGDESALLGAANALWRDFSRIVADAGVVVDADGELRHIKTRRLVTFFDTTTPHLNREGYIFRERRDVENAEREVTLKFRHPDRYVAESRSMDDRGDTRSKFEEDIKAPFVSLYSFSATVRVGGGRTLNELGDVAELFPDVAGRLAGFRENDALVVVSGFTARELVVTGASLQIGKSPEVNAECALIVWHDHGRRQDRPVVVELSYRYGDKDENFGGGTARRAFETFGALQRELREWLDPTAGTKTAFVYE